ncbi:retrovirus-related pol polyprotein from transposon TNT 1-94 [Tanacetum coccineum]
MANLSEDIQCAGSDTRPPMLDRTDFASWQQRIRLYCRGKENGVNILKSIDEGPFQIGTFWETLAEGTKGALGPKRPRVYSDLSPEDKERYNADIRATNILLQGLPKDIYSLINHYTNAKDIWDNVKMLLEGSELTKEDRESQLYDDFEHFLVAIILEYVTALKLNRGLRDSNYDQLYAYLKQHETRYVTDRQAQKEVALEYDQLNFMQWTDNVVDKDVDEQPVQDLALNVDNVFQADDCDAFDSDVDEAPMAQTMFMANLSSADPDYYEKHEMHDDERKRHVIVMERMRRKETKVPYHPASHKTKLFTPPASRENHISYHTPALIPVQWAPSVAQKFKTGSAPQPRTPTLPEQKLTRKKMNDKMKNPECVQKKVKITPLDYSKENYLATFTPQKQLTPEQIFWSQDLIKMKAEALKTQATTSRPIKALTVYPSNTPATLVPGVLPTKRERGFKQTKACYLTDVIPFFKTLKEHFKGIQKALTKEIKEIKDIFDELEAEVDQNGVDRKHDEIERKNLLIANDNLIADCLSKEVFYVVTNSELNLKYQNLKESFGNNTSPPARDVPDFDSVFVIEKMKASIQGKDNAIKKLRMQISQLKETRSEADRTLDFRTLDFQITQLTEKINVLQEQNELFREENRKIKQHYKELYDSIKITRAKHLEQTTALLTKNESLKVQIQNKLSCVNKDHVKPKVLAPGKYAIDVEPIPPRNRNNREVHLVYLKHLKESVETLREIVEEAKVERPLDSSLASACLYTKHSQELLEYKKQVTFEEQCAMSKSNTQKPVEQLNCRKTNVPVPPSTGVNSCTDAIRSQPRSNTKKNRILKAKSVNMKKVEEHPRTIKSSLKTTNRVDSSISSRRTIVQIVLWYLDSGCSKHMTGDRSRLRNFVKKFIWAVRFGNDHFGAIMGYRDYVIGKSVISRVYYVEGLGHNLFFVGQFCDSGLEVAFKKHSCYVRDTDDVELIKGSRGSNLYTISIEDMMKSSPICLLSKASKNKSWLWHRHLNHLNFGKSKKHTHKPKTENINLEVLHTLHMDLCGPMRVQTINRKKYILVIVVDYSRFAWVKFLRSKDETLEVEAVATACYTKNRSLIYTHHCKTPYELVHDKKPDLTFFRVFGALYYPTNDSEYLGKLQPTADIRIFVSYAPSRKGYRIYNKRTRLNSAGTPSSTTIDQDAPSPSHSPSSSALQSLCLHQGVAAKSTLIEDNPFALVVNNPFINVFALEPSSEASSFRDLSSAESPYVSQTVHHLGK